MQPLTDQGWQTINQLARRYGVSTDAVMAMLQSLIHGDGTMAQFNHRELGGGGQWMQGGMTMVGDMFNHGLKSKVDGLCNDLSRLLAQQPFVPPVPVTSSPSPSRSQSQWQGGQNSQHQGSYGGDSGSNQAGLFATSAHCWSGSWWPGDLGLPNSSGGQNNVRYAYFAGPRRLAVEQNGQVSVYDTLDHQISGVSQQQGPGSSLSFTSQYGTVNIASLPIVSGNDVVGPLQPSYSPQPRPQTQYVPDPAPWQPEPQPAGSGQDADIFAKIERLADLQQKGILSQEEYAAKKAELLGRL